MNTVRHHSNTYPNYSKKKKKDILSIKLGRNGNGCIHGQIFGLPCSKFWIKKKKISFLVQNSKFGGPEIGMWTCPFQSLKLSTRFRMTMIKWLQLLHQRDSVHHALENRIEVASISNISQTSSLEFEIKLNIITLT